MPRMRLEAWTDARSVVAVQELNCRMENLVAVSEDHLLEAEDDLFTQTIDATSAGTGAIMPETAANMVVVGAGKYLLGFSILLV